MRMHVKLMAAAVAAAIALSAAVSNASARRIQVSELLWHQVFPSLTIGATSGEELVQCPLTLEGSFHSRTLSKVCGQLIGYITRITVGGCAVGGATALAETLPWHIRYESFSGILPRIESLNLWYVGVSLRIMRLLPCLFRTSAEHPGRGIVNVEPGGLARSLESDPRTKIPAGGCFFSEATLVGASEVFAGTTANTTRITVRLVQ